MMRTLLATTAVATLIATGAFAQSATTTAPAPSGTMTAPSSTAAPMVKKAEGHLASNLIGETVYNGSGSDAKNIGEVNDLVIGQNGQVEALIVGVGGFLGIGEKNVALEYKLAKWESRDNDEFLVIETTADALKAQPEFEAAAYEMQAADSTVAVVKPATAEDLAKAPQSADAAAAKPASDTVAAAPAATAPAATETAQAPAANAPVAAETDSTQTAAIDRSKLTQRPVAEIKADDFEGTTIYGANDANIGEVNDVVLSQDGKVDAVLVDVGGFLGIGGKTVAMGIDNLQFMADEDGDLYVYSSLSKEQLEAQPAYEQGSYAQNRDAQRMSVPAMQ